MPPAVPRWPGKVKNDYTATVIGFRIDFLCCSGSAFWRQPCLWVPVVDQVLLVVVITETQTSSTCLERQATMCHIDLPQEVHLACKILAFVILTPSRHPWHSSSHLVSTTHTPARDEIIPRTYLRPVAICQDLSNPTAGDVMQTSLSFRPTRRLRESGGRETQVTATTAVLAI